MREPFSEKYPRGAFTRAIALVRSIGALAAKNDGDGSNEDYESISELASELEFAIDEMASAGCFRCNGKVVIDSPNGAADQEVDDDHADA